jgi:AcrR family transcriptional regulator
MEEPRLTQAERRARSERSLLDAAEQLFAEKGSHRTSLAEIGERAGYSRGLVGERFGWPRSTPI